MRYREPLYLRTPDGLLRWDPSGTGGVKGMKYRATLNGRAITLQILLEKHDG